MSNPSPPPPDPDKPLAWWWYPLIGLGVVGILKAIVRTPNTKVLIATVAILAALTAVWLLYRWLQKRKVEAPTRSAPSKPLPPFVPPAFSKLPGPPLTQPEQAALNAALPVLEAANLGDRKATVLSSLRTSIRMEPKRCEPASLGLGASRFDGEPDLPDGFDWPCYRDQPLDFLAQIDLAALPELNTSWLGGYGVYRTKDEEPSAQPVLPRKGWLLFFYDANEQEWGFDPAMRGSAAVRWVDCPRELLRRTARPRSATPREEKYGALGGAPYRLSFAVEANTPSWGDDLWGFAGVETGSSRGRDNRVDLGDVADQLSRCADDFAVYHHLLGHPQLIQNGMQHECELASSGIYCGSGGVSTHPEYQSHVGRFMDWELLAQFDSDHGGEAPSWTWGDVGRLYFWIRRQDLAARDFSKVWLILQCY